MSKVQHVSEEAFDDALPETGIAVVDLSASWCGPCHTYAPIFENSAARHPHITHLSLDVDESPGIAERYNVMSVPTTIFIRDRILVGGFPGVLHLSRLDDLINQTEQLNMEDVKTALNNKPQG